jgi:N-acetylglutamate synthase-like GNAT family acetyltransferase
MNNKSKVSFSSFKKEDPNFEEIVKKANELWGKTFGNEYGEDECPGDCIVIGCIDDNIVCCTIIEYWEWKKTALISCMSAYPQKCGYGSLLMENIIKDLKTSKISKVYLKIDKDENAIRLEKFYSQFGFVKDKADKNQDDKNQDDKNQDDENQDDENQDDENQDDEDLSVEYDSDFEYVMSYVLDKDLDLDLTNLKIDS